MLYCFLCGCQSNTKNIFAKFHENKPNLSEEIEKNTESMHFLIKKINSKQPQEKGNTTHKVLQPDSYQSFIKNICTRFRKKPNNSNQTKIIHQNDLEERRFILKTSNSTNIFIHFLRQCLTALKKQRNSSKMGPKII